jgi:tRNA A-37 threonylcarbamoyl transferase component Bud32
MKTAKYLRDARHLDKFMYTLMDELFYEPLETRYRPWDEYKTPVTELIKELALDWTITRDGFWQNVHPISRYYIPAQGWKVHVSANIGNAVSILKRAAKIALTKDVPFKFALDKNVLATMSSKRWNRGGSGKFITMYPSDLSSFKDLLETLYAELHSEEGPYILSDKRYKDCRVLYYRYGGLRRVTRTDIKGEKVLVLTTPDGQTVPDVRTPYFSLPPGVSDPFPTEKSERKEIVLNNRFAVKKAISFSNSGGVYVAEDRDTGKEVIIKEARPHTAMDDRGNDAVKLLRKEYQFLELMRGTNAAPEPVDAFEAAEHFFIAEEYLDGIDVREIMLTQSPLMLSRPSLNDSREYYEIYRRTLKAFVQVVDLLHKKGIVFGDLNAKNIKIDPATHTVRLIDFEGAFRPELDQPTYLYTPGFKSVASIRKNTQGFEDDLFALAANLFYMLFPIAAFTTLSKELFDKVLRTMLNDIGWSQTEVFNVINGFAKNEMTCARACELLDKPAEIVPPSFADDIDVVACDEISQQLGRFILAHMRPDRDDALFPADPFIHRTNTLSLGFGASGVLYTLKRCGFEIPKTAFDWLETRLDKVDPRDLPPGLLTGASGVAWGLSELGLEDRALELMQVANESALLKDHHSYLYGMAGIGMANLHFYARTNKPEYLGVASELGDALLRSAKESEQGIYWENDGLLHLGYGYGQSGVALFLLRLFQVTGKERFRYEGRRALGFDLSHGEERENGVLSFPRAPGEPTVVPYLEEGSAGIAKVAIRYGMWDERLEKILADVHRKYSGFVGLMYGLGSFVDVLTDAYLFSDDVKYLEMAKRPITGIRDLYLLERPEGWATPGDNLFRVSCDYATGVAGVMRALHRFTHQDKADFTLDEVGPAATIRDLEAALQPVR